MVDAAAYAEALRTVAKDPAAAWREVEALARALSLEPELRRGLVDAAARRGAARGTRLAALLRPVSPPVRNLVHQLLIEGSADALAEVSAAFARRLQADGYSRVHLETAEPLDTGSTRRVLRSLGVAPAKALVTSEVDPDLIGGVRATVDGRAVDASLGGRLDLIAEALGARV